MDKIFLGTKTLDYSKYLVTGIQINPSFWLKEAREGRPEN